MTQEDLTIFCANYQKRYSRNPTMLEIFQAGYLSGWEYSKKKQYISSADRNIGMPSLSTLTKVLFPTGLLSSSLGLGFMVLTRFGDWSNCVKTPALIGLGLGGVFLGGAAWSLWRDLREISTTRKTNNFQN